MDEWVKPLATKPNDHGTHMVGEENQLQQVVSMTSKQAQWHTDTCISTLKINKM